MNASFNKGATLIALRPLPAVAGRSFSPGDIFPWRRLAIAERRVVLLIDQGKLGELSQQTYDFAMKQREASPDGVPRGFTADGLKAMGITLKGEKAEKPKAEKPKEVDPGYQGFEDHRGYRLGKKKRGQTWTYDVLTAEGARLNEGGMLRGMKQVDNFIDLLEAEAAKNAPTTESVGDGEGGGETAPPEPPQPTTDAPSDPGEGGGDPAPATEELIPGEPAIGAPDVELPPAEGDELVEGVTDLDDDDYVAEEQADQDEGE